VTIAYDVPRIAAGVIGGICAPTIPFATHAVTGSYVDEGTASAVFFGIYADAAADFDVDNVVRSNLSISTITPRQVSAAFAGLTFVQATAANMQWKSSTLVNGKQAVEGSDTDGSVGSLDYSAYAALHSANNTVFHVYKPTDVATNLYLHRTFEATTMHCGYLVQQIGGKIKVSIGNASGTLLHALTSTAAPTINAVNIAAHRLTAGSALDLWVNGGAKDTQAPTGAVSGADPYTKLRYGDTVYSVPGHRCDHVVFLGALTDAEIAAVGKALAAKWGGTWV
jgi:hypothetical protein